MVAAPEGHITTSEAAIALRCSASTVLRMYAEGRLAGQQGPQPKRRRVYIRVNDRGQPLDRSGKPVGGASLYSRLDDLERRIAAIEDRLVGIAETERVRLVEPMLESAIEHQKRANQLQVDAAKEQEAASKEQARVVSTLKAEGPHAARQTIRTSEREPP